MKRKTSIRYFNGKIVRAVWDNASSSFLYSATDLIVAFTNSKQPRTYWSTFKQRHPEIKNYCKKKKITANDGKEYESDVINYDGINILILSIKHPNKQFLKNWIDGKGDPIDEQSKQKAYELWDSGIIENLKPGTIESLKQIHAYIFEGLYKFAGQIRDKNISKGGFMFANCAFLNETLKQIEKMPSDNIDQIIDKYVEMNIAHPFLEGNGRATRIWLDVLLKNKINMCVDWSKIEKVDYLSAMEESPNDSSKIMELLKKALTNEIHNREVYLKGVDYSYYYEEV